MVYSILSEARIAASISEQGSGRPYSVFWSENGNLQGWNTFIGMDVVGSWNGFLFSTITLPDTSTAFIGPTNTFPPIDALINDTIFFRLKYDKHPKNRNPTTKGKIQWVTTADPIFNDTKSIEFPLFTDGKWHFYELDMNLSTQWVGSINKIHFFPATDGFRNDEFFLNFFEIGSTDFSFSFDNSRSGLPGTAIGASALLEEIIITKDVNDKLIVNLDSYGDVQITLTPQSQQPSTIARDISAQLAKLAIGGYIRAQARIDPNTKQLIIESGTRASDSTVRIGFGENSASTILGLTEPTGLFIGTTVDGIDPAIDFNPISAYRPTTLEILSLFDNDSELSSFTLNPQSRTIQAGRRDFSLTGRRLKSEINIEGRSTNFSNVTTNTLGSLDATSKTFIDINHPFSDDGKLFTISFNGISNVVGGSKWKIFRPQLNGTITLINEGVIGKTTIIQDPNNGLVLSTEPGVFTVDLTLANVKVRRGDLLGIFNVSMHVGAAGTRKVDAMYYSVDGDVQGNITPPQSSGAGEAGLPIYAIGLNTKKQAVVDIDLQRRLNINTIQVFGEENARDLEYNIGVANSTVYNTDVPGSHVVCYVNNISLGTRDCFNRPNAGFNLPALNDDILFAQNGISSFGDPGINGLGGATVAGATYFYANGDGEQLGIFDLIGRSPQAFNFLRAPIGIDCIFSQSDPPVDKPIGKAIMYFKDRKNQRAFQIETKVSSGGGNGSKNGFQLIPSANITAVTLDGIKRIERFKGVFLSSKSSSNLQTILLENPVLLDVITGTGVRNPKIGEDFVLDPGELGGVNLREQATFIEFQWTSFQWEFETIRTSAFRWFSDFHWSTKISEFQVFGVSKSFESLGDNIQVLFSSDGETFTTATLLRASTTDAEYKIGGSPQFLRLIFRPTLDLNLADVKINFEEDQVCFGIEGREGSSGPLLESKVGSFSAPTILPITNSTGQTADLIIDLPPDTSTSRQLMYFSQLHNDDDIKKPQVGPPGRIDFIQDKTLNEGENVAINAKAYGLRSLASGTNSFSISASDIFPNQGNNTEFDLGDLTGYDLIIVSSGTKNFQSPRVFNAQEPSIDSDPNGDIQITNAVFGHHMDIRIPNQEIDPQDTLDNIVPTEYTLTTEVADISSFSENIDAGTSKIITVLRFLAVHEVKLDSPVIRWIGSPTLVGSQAVAGTVVNPTYGTNLLRSEVLQQGEDLSSPTLTNLTVSARLKPDTRFIRIEITIDAVSERITGVGNLTNRISKFMLARFSNTLSLVDTGGVKWYKSYRTGLGDFTDSHFDPVIDFVTTTGSSHWYQPYIPSTIATPDAGQSVGFSNAFISDRYQGIQGFRRMTSSDAGILGTQWSGDKTIVGFRGCFQNGALANQCGYPRKFHVEALKTKSELGGIDPNINNPAHFKIVQSFRFIGSFGEINNNTIGESLATRKAPNGPIVTFLFDTPVVTEGIRMVITTNCDIQEMNFYDIDGSGSVRDAEFTVMNTVATCPDNLVSFTGFTCSESATCSMFQPLEAPGNTNLPIDNVIDWINRGNTNIFLAVDLGREFDLDLNTDLFELIADTITQSEFTVGSAIFGDDDTNDPNLVIFAGSSSSARWIRFSTTSEFRWEDPNQVSDSDNISNAVFKVIVRPQSFLRQARIYPRIQTTSIFAVGLNTTWDDLGQILTNNDNTTFINYSDYPIVAMDLGKAYLLDNEQTIFRKKHDLVSGDIFTDVTDRKYWNPDLDFLFTYSSSSFQAQDNPSKVEFSIFGTSTPDIAIRWVAFRGNGPLQIPNDINSKNYNFKTRGGRLMNSSWKPRNPEPFTQNPTWFTTRRVGLNDISTFFFDKGNIFSSVKNLDYGSNLENRGDPINAFDGRFVEFDIDIWGVEVRDPITGLDNPDNAFPHIIWRVFRDPFRGDPEFKTVAGFRIKGYNEQFFPTDFVVQKLIDDVVLPQGLTDDEAFQARQILLNDNNWKDINDEATFIGVDTFAGDFGFTEIFREGVLTRGLRFIINNSKYPDDSVQEQPSDTGEGQGTTFASTSGPQTRVKEIVIYEQSLQEATLTGDLEVNHSLSADFMSNTQAPGHASENMKDGKVETFWQSIGFTDTVTITLPSAKPISLLRWTLDPDIGRQTGRLSTNAPSIFRLRAAKSGGGSETLISIDDFIGTTFSGTFSGNLDVNGAFTSDTFFFDILSVQGEQEDADSCMISELSLIENTTQTEPLVVISEVIDRHPNSISSVSTLLTYARNTDAVVSVFMDAIDGNNDELFSERDFFQFYLKINDTVLLDKDFGKIRLGNSEQTFYEWNISDFADMLISGWNTIKLQFKTASDKSEKPFRGGPDYDPDFGQSQVDFITADAEISSITDGVTSNRVIQAPGIRYFEIEFRGKSTDTSLELTLDDFKFIRNRFDDVCRFEPSLYLNNSETFLISLEGIDIATGTVEFWLKPDWNTGGIIRANTSIIPALFRIMRPDGKFLSFFYRPNTGFVAMIFDGRKLNQFESNILKDFTFEPDIPFHLALVWDTRGRASGSGATLAMYKDGVPFYGTTVSWKEIREGGTNLIIGGELGQRFAAGAHNSTALTFTAVPTLPVDNTASVWGVMENLKIYNYAKTNFDDREQPDLVRRQLITPSELVQISLDGISWSSSGSDTLPLTARTISADEVVNVHIRTNIPRFGLTGDESRDASLLVRWKTPLQNCD